jgi:alpha-beta hydrolase superfamily lysophospholipase
MSNRLSPLRILWRLGAAALVLYLALSVAGGIVLMEGALHLNRRLVTERGVFVNGVAGLISGGITDASVTAADGAVLKGWNARPATWNGKSVILLHGVGDNREGVTQYALMFLRAGYAVLLPDSRGHGESGGALVTYGLVESQDVRRWSIWIADHATTAAATDHAGCIYLFGESMGAAIALEASATVPGLCAVVAEAPFSSFREIGYERIAQRLGWNVDVAHVLAWPMVDAAFLYARLRHGLDFDRASPERVLAASRVPALLIAGSEDRNISMRHSERILKASQGGSELWRVIGAEHTSAASVDFAEFECRVLGWFGAHTQVAGVSKLATNDLF